MLKRTLVSAAIAASLLSGTAQAASVAATGIKYSSEGSEAATSYAAPEIVITLGADYQVGDLLKISFNADFDSSTAPSPVVTGAPAITLGVLSSDDNSYTYRVTSRAADATGETITFSAGEFDFEDESVEASGGVDVTYSAQTNNGTVIDNSTDNLEKDIITVIDELSSEVTTSLDQTVDVSKNRLEFVGGGSDVFTVTTSAAAVDSGAATVTKEEITLTGDFSWIIDTDEDTDNIQAPAGVVALTGTGDDAATVTIMADKIVVSDTGATQGTYTLTIDPDSNFVAPATAASVVIPNQSFTTDVVTTYTVGAGNNTDTLSASAGLWKLNGKSASVFAYPLGDNISQFLWVSNNGTIEGEISVDVIANGQTISLGQVAVATARSSTPIAGEVLSLLQAQGLTSGRVQIDVTVNAPKDNIDVYAGYKVNSDADRLNLNVTSN